MLKNEKTMTIQEQILLVNSKNDAMNFWLTNFGEPDYFSTIQDADAIESLLSELREDFDSLKREISRTDTKNQFKLNKAISLHFILNEGEHYLAALRIVVESKCVPIEEEVFSDEYGYPLNRESDDDDRWREDSLFKDYDNLDDDYETPDDW